MNRVQTIHSSKELLFRAKIALDNLKLIEIVESHRSPSGTQKAAMMLGFTKEKRYSVWALAALKRDCLEIYENLPEIKKFRIASKGSAEETGV